MKSKVQYRRVLIKLSGEALVVNEGHGIDQAALLDIAKQIKDVKELGIEIAIVLGGGNIYRGKRVKRREWTG